MGLFSGKTKYKAYAATSALFEEEDRPDTLKSTFMEAALTDLSFSQAIMITINTDLGARGKSMTRYGAKKYLRRLPTSTHDSIYVKESAVFKAIEKDIGEPIDSITWMFSGSPNEDFLINKHINEVYMDTDYFPWPAGDPDNTDWDEDSESVEIPVVNPDTGKYYLADNPPTFNRITSTYDYDYIQSIQPDYYARLPGTVLYDAKYRIGYDYVDNLGAPAIWEMVPTLDLTQYESGDWIQAKYSRTSTPDEIEYWTYLVDSMVDPVLEASIDKSTSLSSYMPVAILMQDKVWFNEDPESELAKTTNKLLKNLAIDGDEVKEDFLEQEAEDDASGDSKKSDADKWDFFIHFACPIKGKVRGSLEYLYLYFLDLEKKQQYTFDDYQRYLGTAVTKGYSSPQPVSELRITEGGVNGYNVAYRWSYVYSEEFDGLFLVNGEPLRRNRYHSEFHERNYDLSEYQPAIESIHGDDILIGKYGNEKKDGYHDFGIFTKQYKDADGNDKHTRVIVMSISMEYTINTRETSTKSYRFRYAEAQLFNTDNKNEDSAPEFRIPINNGVLKEVAVLHREEVLGESLATTVLLVQEIHIKWYQTGFFKWLIIIIAIILIVLSIFFPGFIAAAAKLIALSVGAGASGIVYYVVYTVLLFAAGWIIATAGSLIGGTLGMVFTIIGTIIVVQGGGAGLSGWDMFWNVGKGASGWANAVNYVTTIGTYINMGYKIYVHEALADLEREYQEFLKSAREQQQEIEDAWATLNVPTDMDILNLTRAQNIAYYAEYPDSFLTRTLNTNPGMLGYAAVNNFSELALQLPKAGRTETFIDSMFEDFAVQRGVNV